jgi:hypothetical protein
MTFEMEQMRRETKILDYTTASLVAFRLRALKGVRGNALTKLRALYDAITKLRLGYNRNDDVPASEVLRDGYGQCNTKAILLLALARGAGIPSRVHAYRLTKELQRERHAAWLVFFMPRTTLFFWPEFFIDKKWRPLEELVHEKNKEWTACPFDGARYSLTPVPVNSVEEDHDVWDSPDAYFEKHKPTVTGWRKLGFALLGRRLMNARIRTNAC